MSKIGSKKWLKLVEIFVIIWYNNITTEKENVLSTVDIIIKDCCVWKNLSKDCFLGRNISLTNLRATNLFWNLNRCRKSHLALIVILVPIRFIHAIKENFPTFRLKGIRQQSSCIVENSFAGTKSVNIKLLLKVLISLNPWNQRRKDWFLRF